MAKLFAEEPTGEVAFHRKVLLGSQCSNLGSHDVAVSMNGETNKKRKKMLAD